MSKNLDILFVHSNSLEINYQELANEHSAIEPNIWAGMLANSCKSKGFSSQILDCEAEHLTTNNSAKEIVSRNSRLICFVVFGANPNASTQSMEGNIATAKKVKELNPNSKIIFVGPHVSAVPRETLNEGCVDIVCTNEGVYALHNLLKCNVDDNHDLLKIKGIGFKTKEGLSIINEPERIVPKDFLARDLPGIAWDLMPNIKYFKTSGWHSWSNNTIKTPFASLYTSLGCPYKCSYCMINILNRTDNALHISAADSNIFRYWDPEFIIKQFDIIAQMGVKNVKIADELFVYNPKHFLKICDLIIERKYDFNIWCYSRVDTCKPEYLDRMKKAGINWLGIGVENPNQVLRKEVHKGGFKEVKIDNLFSMMRNAGINIGANYIFGLPKDTKESIQNTVEFMMNNLTEFMNIYSAMALPGSPLYLEARKNKVILPDRYAGYSQHSYYTQNLPTDTLSAAEILQARDDCWTRYFTNSVYLQMMEKKFGKVCTDNIKASTQIKLKRRLLGD